MSERTFSRYLSEFRTTGLVPYHAVGTPVLIRYGANGDDADPERAFRTAFGRVESQQTGFDRADGAQKVLGEVVLIAKKEGAAFPEQIGLGRASNTDVCLPLTRISKYHAFFTRESSGRYSVTDAGSKNGTWVDGQRLAPRVPTLLSDGSRLLVGPHKFMFYTYDGLLRLLKEHPGLPGGSSSRPSSGGAR